MENNIKDWNYIMSKLKYINDNRYEHWAESDLIDAIRNVDLPNALLCVYTIIGHHEK